MSGNKIAIPGYAAAVINRLNECGADAYIVGGCVRDSLLGRVPGDYDVTTSAAPEEMLEIFRGWRVIETGMKHGTVTVLSDGKPVETTTFREDGEYSDNRRPDSVSFVRTLEKDLSRRDFTVNAMAFSERDGLIDLFGGVEDLKNGVIRCVGEPEKRFHEDALRIMRAIRFASVLGFELEENTKKAVFSCRELLKNIAAERVASELMKLLCGKNAGKVVREYVDVLGVWLPELLPMKGFKQNHPFHIHDVLGHTCVVIDNVPPVPHMRLTALLHDTGKPEACTTDEEGLNHFRGHPAISSGHAHAVAERLRLDSFTAQRTEQLVRIHDMRIEAEEKAVRRQLAKLTGEVFFELLQIKRADIIGQHPDKIGRLETNTKLKEIAEGILHRNECISLGQLAIGGKDLLAAGFVPGPAIGETLDKLLALVIDGEAENEKEALLRRALEMKTE